jgi:hypothetical protein
MTQIIKYGYYVEDNAQAVLLENLLPQVLHFLELTDKYTFSKDIAFAADYLTVAETGRNEFEQFFSDMCLIGIDEYQQDVFFLGRDLDKNDTIYFQNKRSEIQDALRKICTEKTIIFLPIQCTEHWLRYIKELQKAENQDFTQKFEDQKKRAIKNNLYGRKNRNEKEAYLEELCKQIDIHSLSMHSQSFKHLIDNIHTFLQKPPSI